jgi:hypothetical protein|tara:strand:+ start:12662 stop:13102 length:441 start_codon:yes stop_codon:yes gene_type:complete
VTYEESLEFNFQALELPADAVQWLLDLWHVIQVLDDVADGDSVDRKSLDKAIFATLAGMPSNSFYQKHQAWLLPILAQSVLKWMASDAAERAGKADERSYMWRAGYYDVVMMVTCLVHGPSSEKCFEALAMYGETAEDYLKEFKNA